MSRRDACQPSFCDLTEIFFAPMLYAMIAWSKPRVTSLVSTFGGNAEMARALNHKHHTLIQQWLKRGTIPEWRYREIVEAAAARRVRLPKWFSNSDAS